MRENVSKVLFSVYFMCDKANIARGTMADDVERGDERVHSDRSRAGAFNLFRKFSYRLGWRLIDNNARHFQISV